MTRHGPDKEIPTKLKLDPVTLLTICCGAQADFTAIKRVINLCLHYADFHSVKVLSSMQTRNIDLTYAPLVLIPDLSSYAQYNLFCIKKLTEFVDSDHVLIIQDDGYILNPEAWTDQFLEYDYIGAPWNDPNRHLGPVGNGGFSLRSKRLLHILAHDPRIVEYLPEDRKICRVYRKYLERFYRIKFAPVELAERFSAELVKWKGQFGFHGRATDISDWKNPLKE